MSFLKRECTLGSSIKGKERLPKTTVQRSRLIWEALTWKRSSKRRQCWEWKRSNIQRDNNQEFSKLKKEMCFQIKSTLLALDRKNKTKSPYMYTYRSME